tara:strand:- start:2560 stop:3204 length:645 start_codon:yes stop_codon:yes gene_type:complete
MPLPALGAAAKFIMANGARAAAGKFSKTAVDKAKDQIAKRESAVSQMADKANVGVKKTRSPQSIRRQQDTMRDKRVAKQEARRAPKSPKEESPLNFRGGGMMKSKMKAKGMKAGGKMKAKGYMAGGKMKAKGMAGGGKMKAKGMAVGGPLKKAPEGNTGLKKLPKQVRNKMGFMAKGGMMKTKGYSKGGAAGGKKQKVRGAGIARKGVRPAKMR